MTLNEHLGAAYSSYVGQVKTQHMPALVADLRDSPDLLVAATARQAELVDEICVKCFVSRAHRDILTTALAQAS